MREILFRGKRSCTQEWIYGSLIIDKNGDFAIMEVKNVRRDGHHIEQEDDTPMFFDNETIGQYTGLTDKNGVKIFEGDIVKILYTNWMSQCESDTRTLEKYLDSLTTIVTVKFSQAGEWFAENNKKHYYSLSYGEHGYVKTIGNIHDNPELLEV